MMKYIPLKILLLIVFTVHLTCCDDSLRSALDAPETFDEADRPVLEHDPVEDFELLKPWNYDKSRNANRLYPLVVSLHGGGGSHYKPCIVGDDEEMQAYPCFFLAPTCSDWGTSADWVRDRIEALINEYRIDTNRLYLMGYSMGGSGSYTFARAYYDKYSRLFAGIVRLAGQSQTELYPSIADKTSIWYHIGLNDTETRVLIAEEAYQFIKSYAGNITALEIIEHDNVSAYPRKTKTLIKNNVQIMKKSEYTGVGHSASVPFNDPGVLAWLFSQSLARR